MLTRMSTQPRASMALDIACTTCSRSVTSILSTTALRSIASISQATNFGSSVVISAMATSAPCLASTKAMPRPMPWPPPVTTAVFPVRSASIATSLAGPRSLSEDSFLETQNATQ